MKVDTIWSRSNAAIAVEQSELKNMNKFTKVERNQQMASGVRDAGPRFRRPDDNPSLCRIRKPVTDEHNNQNDASKRRLSYDRTKSTVRKDENML